MKFSIGKETFDTSENKITFLADGKSVLVGNKVVQLRNVQVVGNPKKYLYSAQCGPLADMRMVTIEPVRPVAPKVTAASLGGGPLKAPMTGKVLSVCVKNGDAVEEGTLLLTVEAMKMENRICAEGAGTISGLKIQVGASVTVGEPLLNVDVKL
jgi:biotin carboxyl carrier protein